MRDLALFCSECGERVNLRHTRRGVCGVCRRNRQGRELVGKDRELAIKRFIDSIEGTTMWERANPQMDFSKAPIAQRRTVRGEYLRAKRRSVWPKK